jgi:ribosomal protein S1
MEELMALMDKPIKVFKRGDEVKGIILAVNPKQILVDIGGKSYGIVPARELAVISDLVSQLKVGDELTANVMMPEDENGQVVLSMRRSSVEKRWQILTRAQDDDEPIEVTGIDTVKGGLLIDYAGIRGFIPASQLDSTNVENPSQLRGKKISVKILEIDQPSNRFVVSQKAVTQKDLVESQHVALSQVEDGAVLTARITGIVPFGAFAQVIIPQGEREPVTIEGLIHISEIAWERVENPGNYLKVGQDVQVKVIGKDKDEGKLNLSMKQLIPDPWTKVGTEYKEEQTVKGKVTRISQFGVFVQLEPGIEGLIHVSKMPADFAPEMGSQIKVTIETIDMEKRKMSLSVVATEKPIGYR